MLARASAGAWWLVAVWDRWANLPEQTDAALAAARHRMQTGELNRLERVSARRNWVGFVALLAAGLGSYAAARGVGLWVLAVLVAALVGLCLLAGGRASVEELDRSEVAAELGPPMECGSRRMGRGV